MQRNRRDTLKLGAGLIGALTALTAGSKALGAVGAACQVTPEQPEGPFYPVDNQLDKDTDLTQVQGARGRAEGQVIYVRGQVTGKDGCLPVAGAVVEIWQACSSGKYNHPGDRENPSPLDPNFQYWGRTLTDASGHYMFKTIVPGAYSAGPGWMRPAHIHFKVHKRGFLELTTQLYFAGDRYNAKDLILQKLSASEQKQVIMPLLPPEEGFDPDSKIVNFDIAIQSVL